jgi:hypothetical protein
MNTLSIYRSFHCEFQTTFITNLLHFNDIFKQILLFFSELAHSGGNFLGILLSNLLEFAAEQLVLV